MGISDPVIDIDIDIDIDNHIQKVLDFAASLVGSSRGPDCEKYIPSSNQAPLWCSDQHLPPIDRLKEEGMICAGLINVMRRKAGLSVMVLNEMTTEVLGGTSDWFSYLQGKNRLEKFSIYAHYPKGTMLLRDYNSQDEGHLAVIYQDNDKGVLFSSLIHSDGYSAKKVVIDPCVATSHFVQYNGTTNQGHYTHICLPEHWLIK